VLSMGATYVGLHSIRRMWKGCDGERFY
jgi:hypothetical protein